jgi:hypothetical protein
LVIDIPAGEEKIANLLYSVHLNWNDRKGGKTAKAERTGMTGMIAEVIYTDGTK